MWRHFEKFASKFDNAIGNDELLSDRKKMNFLRSHLTGKALECLNKPTVSALPFQQAWGLVKAKYSRVSFDLMVIRDSWPIRIFCGFCDKDHYTAKCPDMPELKLRPKVLRENKKKVCFCCLMVGHQIRECRRLAKCNKEGCDKFHHVILHRDKAPTQNSPQNQAR